MYLSPEQQVELTLRAEALKALEEKFSEYYFGRMMNSGMQQLRSDVRALLKRGK